MNGRLFVVGYQHGWKVVRVLLFFAVCSLGMSGLFLGCAECRFDDDCLNGASLCQGGQCVQQGESRSGRDGSTECESGQVRPCYTGTSGTAGVGLCRRGRADCLSSGKWGPCLNEVVPFKEVCDNKMDDDCDGVVDNGCHCKEGARRPCFTGKPERKGRGICKSGEQTCRNKAWSECVGEQLPAQEACNGKDDDCDGAVDEDIPKDLDCQVPNAKGPCAKGKSLCESGKGQCIPLNQPKVEACGNGQDDDCDGEVDEPPCACKPGATQECYSGPPGTKNRGLCRAGKQTCSATGGWGPCAGLQLPGGEICNGKDDDCDGSVDNGLEKPCKKGCNKGKEVCSSGQWQPCNAAPADPEVCDGKDNDCNGLTDDVAGAPCQCNPGQSRTCGSNVGSCKAGTQSCESGQWSLTCRGEVKAVKEVCDGKDNDCNGTTDDNITCSLGRLYWSGPGTPSYFCLGTVLFPLSSEMARLCRFPSNTPRVWQKTCISAHSKSFIPMDHSTCRNKIYRFEWVKSGNYHYYYTNNEKWSGYQGDKYRQAGVAFYTLKKQVSGTVECKSYTNWLARDTLILCGNSSEASKVRSEGYTDVKSLGWMSGSSSPSPLTLHGLKLLPLWRSYSSSRKAHFFTTRKSTHDSFVRQGYTNENVSGQGIP